MENKFDYLLALSLPENISNRTKIEKTICEGWIGQFASRHSKAHMTMANHFHLFDYEFEPLLPYLQYKIAHLPPIEFCLSGYGFFETSDGKKRTIYGKPFENMSNRDWCEQMRDHTNARQAIIPHITIAKDITLEQFDVLWPIFQYREWSDSFRVDRLTILKRKSFGIDNHYATLKELKFKNDRLQMPFIYKNRRRRISPRDAIWGSQISLF